MSEQLYELREITLYYKDGGKNNEPWVMSTNMAGHVTDEQIRKHYGEPGTRHNVGLGPLDHFCTLAKIEIAPQKSKACSAVLRLMDEDLDYTQALRQVLGENPTIDRAELEKELETYI